MYEKFNFSAFVVNAAESHFAEFCNLLQIFWAAEKAQWFIPTGPWFLRRWYLYFCCVFWYGYYTWKKIIDITTNKDKPICAVKTDFVSQVYIILIKIHEKNKKYRRRKNQEPVGMSIYSFSATQEVCSKLENQTKCDSTVFATNPLKIHFSHTFWLLELAIIARTNYNC